MKEVELGQSNQSLPPGGRTKKACWRERRLAYREVEQLTLFIRIVLEATGEKNDPCCSEFKGSCKFSRDGVG